MSFDKFISTLTAYNNQELTLGDLDQYKSNISAYLTELVISLNMGIKDQPSINIGEPCAFSRVCWKLKDLDHPEHSNFELIDTHALTLELLFSPTLYAAGKDFKELRDSFFQVQDQEILKEWGGSEVYAHHALLLLSIPLPKVKYKGAPLRTTAYRNFINLTGVKVRHSSGVQNCTYGCYNMPIKYIGNSDDTTMGTRLGFIVKSMTLDQIEDQNILQELFDKAKRLIIDKDTDTIETLSHIYHQSFRRGMLIMKTNTTVEHNDTMPNTILYGPPGTGKTYSIQNDYVNKSENSQLITFHQSYSYEDFIEGIKPELNSNSEDHSLGFQVTDGVFKAACEEAYKLAKTKHDPNSELNLVEFIEDTNTEDRASFFHHAPAYTLCIDEINRGNVSAIFGELITLIEESKRLGEANEAVILLPYSKKRFGVPPNLQIIGTMNTADRSVEALDTALRRRFVFKEMMPDPTLLSTNMDGINLQELLTTINQRIEVLLDRDHTIGHSYFLSVKNKEQLAFVFANQVIPLLQEYFYNDYEKIAMVLGHGFVKKEERSNTAGFFAIESDTQYALNTDRWSIIPPQKNTILKAIELMGVKLKEQSEES